MTQKILLISASSVIEDRFGTRINMRSMSPPLGLLYVAAALQEEGHIVEVLDMNCEPDLTSDEVTRRLRLSQPGVIGMSTLAPAFRNIADTASLCKEEFPDWPGLASWHMTAGEWPDSVSAATVPGHRPDAS